MRKHQPFGGLFGRSIGNSQFDLLLSTECQVEGGGLIVGGRAFDRDSVPLQMFLRRDLQHKLSGPQRGESEGGQLVAADCCQRTRQFEGQRLSTGLI